MSPTPYATAEQYETWSGLTAPPDAERLLRRASELLDVTVTAPFLVDEDGGPLDAGDAEALRDAACAQVRFWTETGEEHDIDGLAGTTVSIGGVSGKRPPVLAPQALRILRKAMLL
jgi:hypothetical protein